MAVSLTATGLSMPASQSASGDANTLDDYEEGTWTGAWVPTGGSWAGTGTGRYTKVGRLVTATLKWVASGTATGNKFNAVGGLPFTSANDTVGFPAAYSCSAVGANDLQLMAHMGANVTQIGTQMQAETTSGWGEFYISQSSSSSTIMFTVSYYV